MNIIKQPEEFRTISIVLETKEESYVFLSMIRDFQVKYAPGTRQIKMRDQIIMWFAKQN